MFCDVLESGKGFVNKNPGVVEGVVYVEEDPESPIGRCADCPKSG